MSTEVERGLDLERDGIAQRPRALESVDGRALRGDRFAARKASFRRYGPLVCRTGQHTGRSPNDKFVVREPSSERHVDWGKVNRPMDPQQFDAAARTILLRSLRRQGSLRARLLRGRRSRRYRLPVRVINEFAWHNLFCRNLFIDDPAAAAAGAPQFTVIDAPSFQADPARHGTNSETVIAVHFGKRLVLIGGHELRRRDEEVDFHGPELPAAAAERALDALLGECRAGRRRRALLRVVGHGQDDAVERSGSGTHRRRRARLERPTASSTSKAAATRRRFGCRRKPSRRSTPRPSDSAPCSRTSSSIRRRVP